MAGSYDTERPSQDLVAKSSSGGLIAMDPLARLKQKREALTEGLGRINAAIEALEENPGISIVLKLLAEAGERY